MKRISFIRFKKTIIKGLGLLILLAITDSSIAQDVNTRVDSLENRLRRLETRIDSAAEKIRAALGLPRTFTRSEIESGNYGSRIKLTTEKSVLEVGGFIQGDVVFSFKKPGKYLDANVPSTIPVPNNNEPFLFMGVRQTRLTLRSTTQTALGELRTQFEFDLFAANNATTFHLRHAWGKLGRLGVGQYWSNFMDIDVFPNIFEYWGPNSMIFIRQPQVRFLIVHNDTWAVHLSAEAPGSQFFNNDTSRFSSRTTYPDVVLSGMYKWDKSHIRLAGLIHPISYRDFGSKKTEIGYGFNLSALIYTYDNTYITAEATFGSGIGKYFNDLGIYNLDAAQKGSRLMPLPAYGGFLFYNFWWNDKLSSAIGYSYLKLNYFSSMPVTDYRSGQYGAANIIYYPVPYVKLGLEYQYGKRTNINEASGNNSRIQFSANYKF